MHAVIEVSSDQAQVVDLGSKTGTLLDGKQVDIAKLRPGDQLLIGVTSIEVRW
jgi:pSer/pThr/pTyr-binding forkhead associated (FHA) protein